MMKKILRICRRQEQGSVIVIFALSLVTLLAFVSLAIDIGMVNMKRAAMMDLCQQIRRARLDAREYVMNAEDPARMIYDISNQCAIENGFLGDLKVYYIEDSDPVVSTDASAWVERRTYKVRIELKQEYQYAFAAAFFAGSGPREITVYLDGGEQKTWGDWDEKVPVWHPGADLRTGSYKRINSEGEGEPHYEAGEYPDW